VSTQTPIVGSKSYQIGTASGAIPARSMLITPTCTAERNASRSLRVIASDMGSILREIGLRREPWQIPAVLHEAYERIGDPGAEPVPVHLRAPTREHFTSKMVRLLAAAARIATQIGVESEPVDDPQAIHLCAEGQRRIVLGSNKHNTVSSGDWIGADGGAELQRDLSRSLAVLGPGLSSRARMRRSARLTPADLLLD